MTIIESKFRILICRHGETEGNVDIKKHAEYPDHVMPLTQKGHLQARELGKFIRAFFRQPEILQEHQKLVEQRLRIIEARTNYLAEHPEYAEAFPEQSVIPKELPKLPHVRLTYSPFLRAIQTKDGIMREAADVITDCRENPFAYEVLFGLQDGLGDKDLEYLPQVNEHYRRYQEQGGGHYVPSLLGESRANVELREHLVNDSRHRDRNKRDIYCHVSVNHGVTGRMEIKDWMKYPIDEPSIQKNPGNTWARYLEGHHEVDRKDHGWVYTGQQAQIDELQARIGRGI